MFRHAVILALCLLALTPPRVCTCAHADHEAGHADAPTTEPCSHGHAHGGCRHDHEDHDSAPPPCHHDGGTPCPGHDDDCRIVTDAPPVTPPEQSPAPSPADPVPAPAFEAPAAREPAAVPAYPPGPAPPSLPVYLVFRSLRR